MQRYGAAAPDSAVRAVVVLLPAYGESAEVYYETARELLARGYAVWVLDGAGQGGSQRYAGPRDLGRSNGFGVDASALEGLISKVVRPLPGRPLVVAASGSAALSALIAAQDGQAPLDGLFLWDPALKPAPSADHARDMTQWKLGGLRADGGGDWVRPEGDLTGRATLASAWQLANPDLRMGGPSWEWLVAQTSAQRIALDPARLKRIKASVAVVAARDLSPGRVCTGLAHCAVSDAPSQSLPRHLAPDPIRNAWRDALIAFVEARIAERVHGT